MEGYRNNRLVIAAKQFIYSKNYNPIINKLNIKNKRCEGRNYTK